MIGQPAKHEIVRGGVPAEFAAAELAELLTAARRSTLELFDLADEAVLHQSPGFGFRPIIWHLAHIGVFEAYWILQKLNGEPPPNDRFEVIFDPIRTPRESSKNLPSRREMEQFLADVRGRVLDVLAASRFDSEDPLRRDGYLFQLILEHEYQHQETLLYLFQMLSPEVKHRPVEPASGHPGTADILSAELRDDSRTNILGDMANIPAGSFLQGASGPGFVYDNELPLHRIEVPAFRLNRYLTTNAEFQEFIADRGYKRKEFWSDEGWAWREAENASAPLYVVKHEGDSRVRTMFDQLVSLPNHPVSGVNWYEAEAYARFRSRRLPTEAEWEIAAAWDRNGGNQRQFAWGNQSPDSIRCNFNNGGWGTTAVGAYPAGQSPDGIFDLNGNVWEWTSTEFTGYPGFRPFPYPEYSQEWFDGDHRVLKGGSWATRAPILRTSFRNFFRRNFRIGFTGIRLAADA